MKKIWRIIGVSVLSLAMLVGAAIPAIAQESTGACFSNLAQAGVPPGDLVSALSTSLAEPGTPESGVDEAAQNIGVAQQVREDVC